MNTQNQFAFTDLTAGQLNAIVKKLGGYEGALKFLRGELTVSKPQSVSDLTFEPTLDSIVHIDRTVRLRYPFLSKVDRPDLEYTGPAKYSLSSVKLWFAPFQERELSSFSGSDIYTKIRDDDIPLNRFLGLQDGLAIQQKDIIVFRKFFGGRSVFLWKSVVGSTFYGRGYRVPYLCQEKGKIILRWRWFDSDWRSCDPALYL